MASGHEIERESLAVRAMAGVTAVTAFTKTQYNPGWVRTSQVWYSASRLLNTISSDRFNMSDLLSSAQLVED